MTLWSPNEPERSGQRNLATRASCRRTMQLASLALVLAGVFVPGMNCERWCPLGGVEALPTFLQDRTMLCSLALSNFFILGGVLMATVLLRRAFCSHLCPLGTLGEWIHGAARRLRVPEVVVPANVDRALSIVKYLGVLAILGFTWHRGELVFRAFDPCYALISRHGPDITLWAYAIAVVLLVSSAFSPLPFCRWLCPLAAVLNPLSRVGLGRVSRDTAACRGCRQCAARCLMGIPVDRLTQVTAARCTACLQCVDDCPAALSWGPPPRWGRRWSPKVLAAVLLLCTGGAVGASYLFPFPPFTNERGPQPTAVAALELRMTGLECRGRANLLAYYAQRDDLYAVAGYLRLEAWPGPGSARVRITYDPTQATQDQIQRALTEPCFDPLADQWRVSPFTIEGWMPEPLR